MTLWIKANRGFGFTELLVSLTILSVVLISAYKITNNINDTTTLSMKSTKATRQSKELKRKLETIIRNIGYNSTLERYDTETAGLYTKRIGVTLYGLSNLQYTSDDTELFSRVKCSTDSVCNAQRGTVDEVEKYGLWLAGDDPTVLPDISGNLILDDVEPCTEKATNRLTTPYKLWTRTKDAAALPPTTVPALVADKVYCLEVRYFTYSSDFSDPNAPSPRLWNLSLIPAFQPPCQPAFDGVTRSMGFSGCVNGTTVPTALVAEQNYYEFLTQRIDKIQIGVILETQAGKREKIIAESPITNVPINRRFSQGTI